MSWPMPTFVKHGYITAEDITMTLTNERPFLSGDCTRCRYYNRGYSNLCFCTSSPIRHRINDNANYVEFYVLDVDIGGGIQRRQDCRYFDLYVPAIDLRKSRGISRRDMR